MLENILQNLQTSEEFNSFLKEYSSKIIKEHVISRFTNTDGMRNLTNCEKMILVKSFNSKAIPPLKELNIVKANLNTFIIPMENRLFTLFSLLEKIRSDEETCELIDELKESNYNLNERTIYNGGNTVLTCVLSMKPKSAMKLLQLGVTHNVTNQTLDTVYKATKDLANYVLPDIYDEILEQRNLLDKKEELIKEYKKLLNYLEQNNITSDINDEYYSEVDEYIDKLVKENSLNEEEKQQLKNALYNILTNVINRIACDVCTEFLNNS